MISISKKSIAIAVGLLASVAAAAGDATAPIFVSNATLDKHVIYQDFAFYQPYDGTVYKTLARQAPELRNLGITDVWFAPPYRALNDGRFSEGYAVIDRYDLGEFPQGRGNAIATKYGTGAQLREAIESMHRQRINAIADIVPNQMFFSQREVASVTAVDIFGNPTNPSASNVLYPGYSKGGGLGQKQYGLIKQWQAKYENGTSPQALGIDRIMVDGAGAPYRYYGPGDARNHLPAWLAATDAARVGALNTIDTYLSVDGYYAAQSATTVVPVYRPYLLYYVDPRRDATVQPYLTYMRAHGFPGNSDDAVRQSIINGNTDAVTKATNDYLALQPGYSASSEAGAAAFRFNKPNNGDVNKNVLQYEFLLGTDIDNSNSTVQSETLNWQRFLLDKYGFDGFRFDAAGHYNTDILRQSAQLMSGRYGHDMNNHLSVIESYVDPQSAFENSNGNGQLAYDGTLYYTMYNTLGQANPGGPLSDIFAKSIVGQARFGVGTAIPNWSFVTNHDQEHNVIEKIPVPPTQKAGYTPDAAVQLAQMAVYDNDRKQAVKQYAPYNVPSAYAVLLTNKDTVPTIFYGDLYESDKAYVSTKTPYYDAITRLLKIRQKFVAGAQVVTYYKTNTSPSVAGQDLFASVRVGTDRGTGVATVIGNNPATDATIRVDMGLQHANQTFTNMFGQWPERLQTDGRGVLSVHVTGSSTPQVRGYLGVWVPTSEGEGSMMGYAS
ncbi:glycoside hydrolase family 70 protein [Burkholderia ambifaria]|jgi:dextransucrase|uniref:glycoside hydrolase family 70 protein n=1 Tax=Burkholderia ambifaria TaxID=152480 RepID=UPI00158E75A7|nr:glycoside hydrolase family 70 protein [Burkholderia ambifaria]